MMMYDLLYDQFNEYLMVETNVNLLKRLYEMKKEEKNRSQEEEDCK